MLGEGGAKIILQLHDEFWPVIRYQREGQIKVSQDRESK